MNERRKGNTQLLLGDEVPEVQDHAVMEGEK
jgi:hypothetical protein